MTIPRAAPGPQVSTGRLRVDAARAIAKLREYQLVDRTAWILEAIRAAVAGGATRIELRGDANDVWLAWDGPAWPVEELPQLFDELVSPEPTDERYHLRLLAAGVNSALGMEPAYLDVYAITPDGPRRARYTPDVLDEPTGDLADSPLRKIVVTPARVPAWIGSAGMLVHLRRRAAIHMLAYLFWEREPPELATARHACRDIAVPLVIGGTTLHRDQPRDISRLSFEGDVEGFVAITDPTTPRPAHLLPTLEIAERGVVVSTYPIHLPPLTEPGGELHGPVPIRVFVDAKRLPTNASRSQVRRDVPPISTAEQRAVDLANQLILAVATEAGKADASDKARSVALALIASAVGGLGWTSLAITLGAPSSSRQLGPLAHIPLFRDATGTPRPIAHAWSGLVYTGRSPLPEELAPWVTGMLWIRRGDPAAAILGGVYIDATESKRQIRFAKRMRASHRKFFGNAPRPATLVSSVGPRMRVQLGAALSGSCVKDSRFEGLTGELGVSSERVGGEILIMYQGRPIERITMPSPIGFDAVIDTQEITPGANFRTVARDSSYDRIELAARCAVIRAVEAIVVVRWRNQAPPDGYTAIDNAQYSDDARMVRVAMGLARELEFPPSLLLAKAAAWCTIDGRWIEFGELRKHPVIGFSSGVHQVEVPCLAGGGGNRLILISGSPVVAKLLPSCTVVDYDRRRVHDDDREQRSGRLAQSLAYTQKFALRIDDPDARGAISPSPAMSKIQLYHTGCQLDTRAFTPTVMPACMIAVDSDSIAPDADWKTAADPGTALSRSYVDWELALMRATALCLVGERPAELVGPSFTGLDNDLGRALCHALSLPRTTPVLDAALFARLRAAPIVHLLGERELYSVVDLVKRFPISIPYVAKTAAPVSGYAPVVADARIAGGIAKLAGLAVVDATQDLELRRRNVMRSQLIAAHRSQPVLPMAFPYDGEHVALDAGTLGFQATGVVGVHPHDRLEVMVRIEGRPFKMLTRTGELPLYAIVDLDLDLADAAFENLPAAVTRSLIDGVTSSIARLLATIAIATPTALADLGPTRKLLAEWLKRSATDASREVLCAAPAFITLQNTLISLTDAAPNQVVRIASWQGDWLGPLEGESPMAEDHGVLRVPTERGELQTIITNLWRTKVLDITDDVIRVQAQRRMARGLIPVPSLEHIPAELKRKLAELGPAAKRLGHGELGLVPGGISSALLHAQGILCERVDIDVLPAVHVAIEAPEMMAARSTGTIDLADTLSEQLASLRTRAITAAPASLSAVIQSFVVGLVRDVIAKRGVDSLPAPIRESIRRAQLGRRIDAIGAPMFELIDGSWVDIDVVQHQIAKFGSAWCVTQPTEARPQDPERRVFLLYSDELGIAKGNYHFIDAKTELELDAKAAFNRQRAPATSLELPDRDDLIGAVDLDGDGITAPRGVVGALLPRAAQRRGFHAHREMHPFDVVVDPCSWPTIAIFDDARLVPDRTWEKPLTAGIWHAVLIKVQLRVEKAIRLAVPRPSGVFAFVRTNEGLDVTQHAEFQVRGAAWLLGAPRPPSTGIDLHDSGGSRHYMPATPMGIGGQLYVLGETSWQNNVLERIVGSLYRHLVQRLATSSKDKDLVAAHQANAIALGHLLPFDLPEQRFRCFRPEPLDAVQLLALFRGRDPVRVLPIAELEAELLDPEAEGVIEDGSELSRVVIDRLGVRVQRGVIGRRRIKPAAKPAAVAPSSLRSSSSSPSPAPTISQPPPKPEKPVAMHGIQILLDHVQHRLVELGVPTFNVQVADREAPLIDWKGGLRFAGSSSRLHAVANAMHIGSLWADIAADAVIAHAITVLDEARTEINAETQRHVLEALLLDR